jgi:hypothetical protein
VPVSYLELITTILLADTPQASKGVGFFQYYYFATGVGGDVAEEGDGPGSFMVKGNVWHLTYGNPEVSEKCAGFSTTGFFQGPSLSFGLRSIANVS